MDNAPSHELRVLAGPQAGASISLTLGATIDVGSLAASGCQVVLRDPQVAEQRLRLRVRASDVRIEVLVGTVDMAGQKLVAPCSIDWPHFLPLRVGETVMAVGDAASPRWDGVLAVAEAAPLAGTVAPAAVEEPAAPPVAPAPAAQGAPVRAPAPAPAPVPRRGRLAAWVAIGGGTLAVAALGLMAFMSLARPKPVGVESEGQRLERLLLAPEFSGLRVSRSGDDQPRVHGQVLTLGDRARLDRGLAEEHIEARVDVQVGEQIANAVRDVFRMNGVTAETVPPASLSDVGNVRVRTASADLPRLQRIEAAARQDVPGLKLLEVENTPPAVVPPPTPVPDDPGKRVASIVPGPVAYVVTVDGTHYFVGALLPSGHRLASITDTEVMLEKDGKLSPLKF